MGLVRSVGVKGVVWLQIKHPTHPSYPHKTVVARLQDIMLVHSVGLISTMGVNGIGVVCLYIEHLAHPSELYAMVLTCLAALLWDRNLVIA